MNPGRVIRENRPLVLLAVLLVWSSFSLVTGTEGATLHRTLSRVVSLTSYPFLKLRHSTVGIAGRVYTFVAEHNQVYQENNQLSHEIVSLRERSARLAQLELQNERLREQLNFVRSQPRFSLQATSVLESYKGMLRIDGGAMIGIQPSMGVITQNGVVGIVTEVADFTATVATIHHMDCRIGAMVLRNRLRAYDGVVQASGSDFRHLCAMEYIDMKEEVRGGDWVVTSPESQFPAGLPIGRIAAVRSGAGLWKSAEIRPAVDPYRLDEVFVILQAVDEAAYIAGPPVALRRGAQGEGARESAELGPPAMPDMRSLQERYAP